MDPPVKYAEVTFRHRCLSEPLVVPFHECNFFNQNKESVFSGTRPYTTSTTVPYDDGSLCSARVTSKTPLFFIQLSLTHPTSPAGVPSVRQGRKDRRTVWCYSSSRTSVAKVSRSDETGTRN